MYSYKLFYKHIQVFVNEDKYSLNIDKRMLQEESTEGTLGISYFKNNKFFINVSILTSIFIHSVQFSCRSVTSYSLQPHELQHARPPCLLPTPRVHPNPCPLSRQCHPTISSSVVHFSSCPQSFPASGSFQISQLFTSDGQTIGVSASTSVLPMNTQD